MDYKEQYAFWCANAPAEYAPALAAMKDDEQALKGGFGAELAFGTAGIRGIMGLGCNRLNEFTVRRTAQGLARWLTGAELPQRCAIGYDSRHNSRLYAEICAAALADAGVHVYVYHELAPTPMLSFAVRQLDCGCGIVVSASHNAGIYNGIKCYGPDGCQMTDAPAAVVFNEIGRIPYFTPGKQSFAEHLDQGHVEYIAPEVWEAYYQAVLAQGLCPQAVAEAGLRVLYTPLCGTGNKPVREIFRRIGVKAEVVACQEQPDGDFKTCEYPNPETDAALNESYRIAEKTHPDLIVGTDPDCDRVAVAVPHNGAFRKLSGNELGCVLLDYILRKRTEKGDLPDGAACVKSIVSTPMADRIAAYYGCEMKNVLTGFKYIGGEILRLEQAGQSERFVFGFEESCGYLKGTYARDKDAVVASMLVCEAAADAKTRGMDLVDALDALYARFGCYAAYVQSVELQGITAAEVSREFMANIRAHTPEQIGGCAVTATADYLASERKDTAAGTRSPIDLPKSNVFTMELGEQGKIIVRPSGTEPKIKLYYTAVGKTWEQANALLDSFRKGMAGFLPG